MYVLQTWAQPPGYVHIMLKDTFAGNMLNATSSTLDQATLNKVFSASLSDGKSTIVLRFVNTNPAAAVGPAMQITACILCGVG
jgi:hypothetical protein